MTKPDEIGTDDLAAWFRISVWTVQRHMAKAGIEPVGKGPHGVKLWPRKKALDTLNARADGVKPEALLI